MKEREFCVKWRVRCLPLANGGLPKRGGEVSLGQSRPAKEEREKER